MFTFTAGLYIFMVHHNSSSPTIIINQFDLTYNHNILFTMWWNFITHQDLLLHFNFTPNINIYRKIIFQGILFINHFWGLISLFLSLVYCFSLYNVFVCVDSINLWQSPCVFFFFISTKLLVDMLLFYWKYIWHYATYQNYLFIYFWEGTFSFNSVPLIVSIISFFLELYHLISIYTHHRIYYMTHSTLTSWNHFFYHIFKTIYIFDLFLQSPVIFILIIASLYLSSSYLPYLFLEGFSRGELHTLLGPLTIIL